MGAVKDKVHNLVQMLDGGSKEAKSLVDTMHRLQSYLEEKTKSILQESLDRLLNTIRMEAAARTEDWVWVLISPGGRVSVAGSCWHKASDPRLKRLKSEGFLIVTVGEFMSCIEPLKSEVDQGRWLRALEFLRTNRDIERPLVVIPTRESEERHHDDPSHWKPSDFLPAPPPHLPLPRGLFKD